MLRINATDFANCLVEIPYRILVAFQVIQSKTTITVVESEIFSRFFNFCGYFELNGL